MNTKPGNTATERGNYGPEVPPRHSQHMVTPPNIRGEGNVVNWVQRYRYYTGVLMYRLVTSLYSFTVGQMYTVHCTGIQVNTSSLQVGL